jgi:hypothetical protein
MMPRLESSFERVQERGARLGEELGSQSSVERVQERSTRLGEELGTQSSVERVQERGARLGEELGTQSSVERVQERLGTQWSSGHLVFDRNCRARRNAWIRRRRRDETEQQLARSSNLLPDISRDAVGGLYWTITGHS